MEVRPRYGRVDTTRNPGLRKDLKVQVHSVETVSALRDPNYAPDKLCNGHGGRGHHSNELNWTVHSNPGDNHPLSPRVLCRYLN
jgi:hypothetical protein